MKIHLEPALLQTLSAVDLPDLTAEQTMFCGAVYLTCQVSSLGLLASQTRARFALLLVYH